MSVIPEVFVIEPLVGNISRNSIRKFWVTSKGTPLFHVGIDYERSLIFLRDSPVGEHANAFFLATACRVSSK